MSGPGRRGVRRGCESAGGGGLGAASGQSRRVAAEPWRGLRRRRLSRILEVSSGNGVAPRRVLYSASSNILGACQCERRTHRRKCFHILALKIQNVNTKHKNVLVARLARPDSRKYPLELGNIHLLNRFHVFDAGASRRRDFSAGGGILSRRLAAARAAGPPRRDRGSGAAPG